MEYSREQRESSTIERRVEGIEGIEGVSKESKTESDFGEGCARVVTLLVN